MTSPRQPGVRGPRPKEPLTGKVVTSKVDDTGMRQPGHGRGGAVMPGQKPKSPATGSSRPGIGVPGAMYKKGGMVVKAKANPKAKAMTPKEKFMAMIKKNKKK